MRTFTRKPALKTLAAALVPVWLAASTSAHAAWEAIPEVTLGADTNNNTRLAEDNDAETTSRMFLDAGIGLANFTERSSLTFAPRIVTDAYSDSNDRDLEADDYFIDASGRRDWRSAGLGFRTSYAKQSILSAELEEATPDDPDDDDPELDPDTGRLVFFDEDREQLRLIGEADFRISERNAVNLEFERRTVDYSGSGLTSVLSRRSGFEDDRLSLGITRRVDERNSVSARLFVSDYHATRNDNDTDSVGVEGRFVRPINQTWRFNLLAGVQRSDYNFLDLGTLQRVDNADTNYTLGAGLRRRAERGAINLDVIHRVNPSASGFLVVRDEVRGYLQRQLSPRFGMQVGARISRTNTLDDVEASEERDYSRVEAEFEWALTRTVFLGFGYEFTRQEFTNEDAEDATSNTVFFGVTYRGMSRLPQR